MWHLSTLLYSAAEGKTNIHVTAQLCYINHVAIANTSVGATHAVSSFLHHLIAQY